MNIFLYCTFNLQESFVSGFVNVKKTLSHKKVGFPVTYVYCVVYFLLYGTLVFPLFHIYIKKFLFISDRSTPHQNMDQSTEKLLKSSNNSPLFGISNYYDSSQSITYDLATNSPEPSIIAETIPTFTLGAYRTRHLSCILENWSESESYNSLPMEVTKKTDDSFNTLLDRKPMSWEAEDVTEYITTLDESCILDIESIERIDKISNEEKIPNPWSKSEYHTWPNRTPNEVTQKMVMVDVHTTDTTDASVKSGGPVLKYPKIMTASCYGALSNPFVDKTFEDVNSVHRSTDELLQKNQHDDFIYLNPMINNQAKCRSPLPTSLSNSFIDGTSSMNVSFTESKSMQSSIEFSGTGTKTTTINPLEMSMISPDGSKCFGDEAVDKFEEVVDQGKLLLFNILLEIYLLSTKTYKLCLFIAPKIY